MASIGTPRRSWMPRRDRRRRVLCGAGPHGGCGNAGGRTRRPYRPASHGRQLAFGVFICTFWGAVLALLLARVATRPTRAFILASTLLTAVSLVSPLAAAHTAESTKLFLAGGHLLTAAIVIPTLARRLPRIRR